MVKKPEEKRRKRNLELIQKKDVIIKFNAKIVERNLEQHIETERDTNSIWMDWKQLREQRQKPRGKEKRAGRKPWITDEILNLINKRAENKR